MRTLALLGKEIAHSKGHEVYENLLAEKINYIKFDIKEDGAIPQLDDLFKDIEGLSITSPYKKHFLKNVVMTPDVEKLDAINCIKKVGNSFHGTNTDYLALLEILGKFKKEVSSPYFIIIGDGSMSKVTQLIASDLNIGYQVISRKLTSNFQQYKLVNYVNKKPNVTQVIYINTCSREYSFTGDYDSEVIFLDYNYQFTPHKEKFKKLKTRYIDGIELLRRQAYYALKYWGIV